MTAKPPKALIEHLRKERCVLFAGSGLSAAAGLPTWKPLLESLVEELYENDHNAAAKDELGALLKAEKLLEVAEHCKEKLGPKLYSDFLSEKLRGDKVAIPEPHKLIAQLPFAAIVTTNYDKLLERAYGDVPRTPTHTDTVMLGPLLFNDKFFILKAHGDIDHADGLVFTTRDYSEIIHANPAFNALFSAILLTKAVLFVGYSLSDPDFRLMFDRQLTNFKGFVPERYALMRGVGDIERDVLWRTANIRVLPYDEHDDIVAFFQLLQEALIAAPL